MKLLYGKFSQKYFYGQKAHIKGIYITQKRFISQIIDTSLYKKGTQTVEMAWWLIVLATLIEEGD